ncbi:hypothetical protein [Niallia circulans]|uniref:hypothetical protein n=1 Tax=Niallia circulans TaxID=1397 RepID=UPI0026ECAB55|nr:hypothetical protein [Niallia circulans]
MTKNELVDVLVEKELGTKTELKKKSLDELKELHNAMEETNESAAESVEEETEEQIPEEVPDLEKITEATKVSGEYVGQSPLTEVVSSVEEVEITEPDSDMKEVHKEEIQLRIFTEFVYHVRNLGARVKVENLGMGDFYVNKSTAVFGKNEDRVIFGENKEIDGTATVSLISASQPLVRITELL